MNSPITELINVVSASPFRVAPEAAVALNEFIEAKNLSIHISDDPRVFADIDPLHPVIRLGIYFLEVLWAAAHAFIVIFHEYVQSSKRGDDRFEIAAHTRTATAYTLYRTLLQAHATQSPKQWPSDEIRPVRFPQEGTDGHAANELFLVAISWVIHHEIAHARLGHETVTVASIRQENEADRAATLWVCDHEDESGPLFKRALGIATASITLLSYDLEAGRTHSLTHPPSFERLVLNLDNTGLAEDHMIYAFAFVIAEIHLIHAARPYEIDRTGSFRDMLVSACLAIRALANGGGQ